MDNNRSNSVTKSRSKERKTVRHSGGDASNERQTTENASPQKAADRRKRKRVRRSKHNCKQCHKLRSCERSKESAPHQRDKQLKMRMCNETSPSKPSTSSVLSTAVRTDSEKADVNDSDDDDISIHTDEDSDGPGGFVNPSRKECASTTTVNEVCSSTPVAKIKKVLSVSWRKGRSRGRKSKQLRRTRSRRKAKNRSLNRSSTATGKRKQTQAGDEDSEWESATETETLEVRRRLQGRGFSADKRLGQDRVTSDGRLLINVDEDAEEIEEHQIPMKHQLEKTIASGCAKNNLSPSLVKKILRSLVTHDLVKEMLRTTLKAAEEDTSHGGIVYEPKLTRSKMKEVLEKGKDPKLWPVSPVKLGQPAQAGPSILDVEFTDEEDEEDDEYEPSKDVEEAESDEDSIISSQVSDVGSPFPFSSPPPRTPTTPCLPASATPTGRHTPTGRRTPTPAPTTPVASTSGSLSKTAAQSESVASPMGPPMAPPPSAHSTKQRLVFLSPEKSTEEKEEDGIARRTRSKLPLTTTSLYDIEEAFVAPDITADMYDTMCDDSDWQDFLMSLHKSGATDTPNESMEVGEEDDPEFNYIAEAETEEIEAEEVRFDGPFRVTRKELNSLMEELEDLFNEDDYSMIGLRTNLASAHENAALLAKKPAPNTEAGDGPQSSQQPRRPKSHGKEARTESVASTEAEPVAPMILDQQVRQIEEQMRKHIQLTTQMYVLAQGSDDFHPMADECRTILKELDRLRTISLAGSRSAYNTCNLSGALEIVDRDIDWASHRSQQKFAEAVACNSPAQLVASLSSSSLQSVQSSETLPSTVQSACSVRTLRSSAKSASSVQTSLSSSESNASVETVLWLSSAKSVSAAQMLPSSTHSDSSVTQSIASEPSVGSCNSSTALDPGQGRQAMRGAASSHRTRERSAADSASGAMDGDSNKKGKKKHAGSIDRYRTPLLEIQKEVICNSAVFLYPSLLPRSALGLVPLEAFRRPITKVSFSKWEEMLLVMGKEQFKNKKRVYQLIHQHMLPSKTPQQLRCHFYCSGKMVKDKSIVWRYRQTGKIPDTPRDVEEFSEDMVKAPCDQPGSVLPAWCKGYRIHVNAAKRKQEMEEKSRRLREERERKATQRRLERYRKQDEVARQTWRPTEQQHSSSCKHRRLETEDSSSESEEETESEFDSESDWSSDSSYRPPPKRRRHTAEERQNQPDNGLLTSNGRPVSFLPSMTSSPSDKPSVIVTSKGVYVPIHLADPSKVNGALADAHFTVVSDSGEQQVVTTEQLLGSKSANGVERLANAGPSSLVDRCVLLLSSEQGTQRLERERPAQRVEPVGENVEHATRSEQQSDGKTLNETAASYNDAISDSPGQSADERSVPHGGPSGSFSEQVPLDTGQRDVGLAGDTQHTGGETCLTGLTSPTSSPTVNSRKHAEHQPQHSQASVINSKISESTVPSLMNCSSDGERVRTHLGGLHTNASGNLQTGDSCVVSSQSLSQCESLTSVGEQLTSDAHCDCQAGFPEGHDPDSLPECNEHDRTAQAETVKNDDAWPVNSREVNPDLQETRHRGVDSFMVDRGEQPELVAVPKQNEILQYRLACPETSTKNLSKEVLESQTTAAVHGKLCAKRTRQDLRDESLLVSKDRDYCIIQSGVCTSTVSVSKEKQQSEQERHGSDSRDQQNPGGSGTSMERNTAEVEVASAGGLSPGSIPSCNQTSSQSGCVCHFRRNTDRRNRLGQTTSDVSTARENCQAASPKDSPIVQFDILHAAMKKILGNPGKDPRPAAPPGLNGESTSCSSAAIPTISLSALPSIVNTAPGVNITVNMVYRSDYTQGKPSADDEDAAEDPSSTTPDGDLGEASSHGEAGGQRETGAQGELQSHVSDDAVSTTSDIGECSEHALNTLHEPESESIDHSGPKTGLCQPSSGRGENARRSDGPCVLTSETGQSSRQRHVSSSSQPGLFGLHEPGSERDENPRTSDILCVLTSETGQSSRQRHVSSSSQPGLREPSSGRDTNPGTLEVPCGLRHGHVSPSHSPLEHGEGPSGGRVHFSEPVPQAGGSTALGSLSSDSTHEGLCDVSSSSPIGTQAERCDNKHSDGMVEFHKSFFKVTSSGSQQSVSEPPDGEGFSTQAENDGLPSAGTEAVEPVPSGDVPPCDENKEPPSHSSSGGRAFGPCVFTGVGSRVPAGDDVQARNEDPGPSDATLPPYREGTVELTESEDLQSPDATLPSYGEGAVEPAKNEDPPSEDAALQNRVELTESDATMPSDGECTVEPTENETPQSPDATLPSYGEGTVEPARNETPQSPDATLPSYGEGTVEPTKNEDPPSEDVALQNSVELTESDATMPSDGEGTVEPAQNEAPQSPDAALISDGEGTVEPTENEAPQSPDAALQDSVELAESEDPQSPVAALPSYGEGTVHPGTPRTDTSTSSTDASPTSRTSTVPHMSWSGLSSVCSSGIVISVTVPCSEEVSDATLSATEEDADSSTGCVPCVASAVSTSDQGLNVDASVLEGSPPPPTGPRHERASPLAALDTLQTESAVSASPASSPGRNPSPDISPHTAVVDQRIPVSGPISSSSILPLTEEEEIAAPSAGSLPTVLVAGATLVDVGCSSSAHPETSVLETPNDTPPQDGSGIESLEQGDVEAQCSPTFTDSAGAGDAAKSIDSDEQSKRQALLKLLEAVTVGNQQTGGCQTEGAFSTKVGANSGVVMASVQPAESQGEEEGEEAIPSSVSGATTPSRSAVKLPDMQAENERSPPPSYTRYQEEEMPASLFDSPASQHHPAAPASESSHPALQLSISPEDPTILSRLGLVPVASLVTDNTCQLPSSQHKNTDTASPSAVSTKVIATLTPVRLSSPSDSESPTAYALQVQAAQERTPTKSPPASLPVLVPRPGPVSYPSPPYVPRRKRSSPKKQQLQKQVRAILPRGYTYELKLTSPTKAAARTLKRKATLFCQRSPNKPLLPKDPSTAQSVQSRPMTRGQSNNLPPSATSPLPPWNRRGSNRRGRSVKKAVAAEQAAKPQQKGNEEGSQEESDETGSEVEDVAMLSQEDSQNEEEAGEMEEDDGYLNDLMAASSTIGYKKFPVDKDGLRTRKEIRREQKLTLLASDVLETDPRKEDRDTAYAEAYLNKVKVAMQKDPGTYTQFMGLLRQFETNQLSPVEAYESLSSLLANYPELLEEFAGFLLPCQALQAGCHLPHQLLHHLRLFLRKLELHFDKAELKYQKILRTLSKWDFKLKSPEQLRETVMPLLRSVPQHLHDDFVRFFPELPPSESHMEREDFEDVVLGDSDGDGNNSPDDFEDIKYAEENDPYRTKRCPCPCHQEMITKRNREGIRHCYNCCLKVVGGQLYFQPSNVTTRRPVSATFHDPVPMPLPPDLPPPCARSRGAFHQSTIRDEPDDNDEDVDDETEEEEAKVMKEEERAWQEEGPALDGDTEEGSVHQTEEEEDAEAAEVAFDEELGGPSPAKRPRASGAVEDTFLPLASRPSAGSVADSLQLRSVLSKGSSMEEVVQQPMPSSLGAQPSNPSVRHNRLLMHSPGGSNLRMRKRLLSMRPGCQPGGTLSVVGPDNTVIMFNSLLPAPALGETLPGLHEQRTFYPLPGEPRVTATAHEPRAGSDRAPYESREAEERGEDGEEEESPGLPTITSPGKNILRGSFAGLLQRPGPTAPAATNSSVFPARNTTEEGVAVGGGGSAASPPSLMSEDSFSVLLEHMQEGGTQGSTSTPLSLQSSSNTDLLSTAMQYAEIRPGESNFHSDAPVRTHDSEVTSGPAQGLPADSGGCSLRSPPSQTQAPDTAWSRETDKLILEMVRDHGDSVDTYTQIAARLQHATPQQVSERVSALMEQLGSSEEETDGEDLSDV